MSAHQLTIDLVTERPSDGAFILVIVEEGPWKSDEIDSHLRRIQDRLYDCVDAVVDGHLAAKFPESRGKPAVVRLACYDIAGQLVRGFVQRFAECIAASEDVQTAIATGGFARSLEFECNCRSLEDRNQAVDEREPR